MSTAQAVTQHLPFLRRYARALTGSQQSGDAYVTAALEALIADPSVVSQASSPRVALYHLFTKIWNSVDVNAKSEPTDQIPRCRSSSGSATSPRCRGRRSCWWRWRASPRRTPRAILETDVPVGAQPGRAIGP